MTKITYTVALDVAINAVADEAVKEKLEALKASIAKRNGGERKPTKTQKENEVLKGQILDAVVEPMTAGEVATQFGISNQKASALLNALVKDGKMSKAVGEKRARAARHFAQKRHMIFVQFFVLTFRVGSAIIQLSNEREEIRNSWTSM